MRVAYYYHQGRRLPPSDPNNNPYGELLCQALERRGVEVEFTLPFDEDYLRRNQGRIDILHFNWPHHDYYHDDAALMEQRMQAFVGNLELARELGYKVVWTAHNLYPHDRTHHEAGGIAAFFAVVGVLRRVGRCGLRHGEKARGPMPLGR